ncbi:MAG: NAD(P)-dependent oxidoreductase [Flavobacteriales bacterium]|nr:NAD(P)-dependent oxidoreductase [Flavobacteriales bacterium]
MKIGIIRERKNPPDFRVPLTPTQCQSLLKKYPQLQIVVESYPERCYSDKEYEQHNIPVVNHLTDCEVILGVKEVPVNALIENKTYLFFSHTIKKQEHNRKLLQAILKKNIRLIDYECLKFPNDGRIIGFGRYAGIVGAYNAFRGWGIRTKMYSLKPAHKCFDRKELENELKKVILSPIKILLTGAGKVGNGAKEILNEMGIREVSWQDFISQSYQEPVYTQVEFPVYNRRKDGSAFSETEFFNHPELFESDFAKFLPHTDLYIAGHFWSPQAPRFFTREELASPSCKIQLIADISCDIGGPIPSTIRASTISEPFYGYDAKTGKETAAFEKESITVMAVDNLPCELPRDASDDFGHTLSKTIIPLLIEGDKDQILEKATIAENGQLTRYFSYLQEYVDEK